MRPKSTLFLPESTRGQPLIEHVMQLSQFFHGLHIGPEVLRVIRIAKTTDPADRKIKRFNRQIPGCLSNVWKQLRFHTAQERHCQVQLIRTLPARTDDRSLNRQQPLSDGLRKFQSEEQAKRDWLIQPAPRRTAETGAGNTVQSCRTRHARPSPGPDCRLVHRLFPAPGPVRSPIQSR